MPIKCSECSGIMKKGTIVDDRPSWDGYGQFRTLRHNGHIIKVEGKEIKLFNLTHKATEVIVVCPKCYSHYVMKDYNYDEANKGSRKIGKSKIKGYGTYHYQRY